nr:hypothetical protein [Tanacetum cinerariifolium]
MDQNIDSSGSDQIQTHQYPVIHPPSQEIIGIVRLSSTNEDHYVQYKEYLENPSNEIVVSNSNQKTPQDSNIRQLIREYCCIEVCEKQKQNIEDTMLELIEVCRQKEFHCMHDNVDDLIESALNSKLLSINLESQRLDKKKQEVKNVEEQPTERRTQPEYSLSMGYEHLSTIPKTESDEVIESSAKNLLPIPSEYEVTSDDENDNDESLPDEDVPIEEFKVYSNPLFSDDVIISDKLDTCCFNAESDFVESLSNRDTLIDSSLKFDFLEEFFGAFMPTSVADEERIRREHEEYISLMERLFTINPCPRLMENFNAIVKTLPTSPILIEDGDSQREEIDIFTSTDELLPLGFENDDSEGEIHFLEELLVDDSNSLPKNDSFYFDHEDDPSFLRPPLEPPDDEFDFEPNSGEVIAAVMNNIDELNEDECFDLRGEIDVFANDEDDDYFPFILVIQIFLPYLIYPEVSPLLLSVEIEDTIFDPGISV